MEIATKVNKKILQDIYGVASSSVDMSMSKIGNCTYQRKCILICLKVNSQKEK